jgi:hypothetical protein
MAACARLKAWTSATLKFLYPITRWNFSASLAGGTCGVPPEAALKILTLLNS